MDSDRKEDRDEISVERLFSKFEPITDPVVHGKIEHLPLHESLTAENFERLVARLAAPANSLSISAFRFGKQGSTQGGVDVLAFDPVSRKWDCYEGKRWTHISQGNITSWVEKFLIGSHAKDARRFVICTSFDVFKVTALANEWKQCAKRLADHHIEGQLWDGAEIQTKLRHRPDIVEELFGEGISESFCLRTLQVPAEPPKNVFATKRIAQYDRTLTLQNVSVSCEVFLPCNREMDTGAIFSFSRRELSGISIAIQGKELVQWMQWRAHAPFDQKRPYASAIPGDKSQVVLMANSARVTLNLEELEHLDWVLQAAWSRFYTTLDDYLTRYRCHRFKRHSGSRGPLALISVERGLWRAMLAFAQEHDVAKGDSPWHIFDGAHGCLKVYTEKNTDRFDRGYHVILNAYETGGIWLPWESSITIGWEIPCDFGKASDISPRRAWDASFTHDWLLEELIPAVLRWSGVRRQKEKPKSWIWGSGTDEPHLDAAIDVSQFATSNATELVLRVVPEDQDGLKHCVEGLQAHFHGRRSVALIEPSLEKAVLIAIERVLTFVKLPYEGYLRGVLNILDSDGLQDAIRLRIAEKSKPVTSTIMDFRLRGLLEVMDSAQNIPDGEWRVIAANLQPVLERIREDLACHLFTSE
ncbi:hypothetical protein [Rhodoferax mekongensis]|uniref:hypothetical protein n=1 Tax=Rhodoferax mekongensis TaxID=3068341 RepID=UPI0028BDB576|nr:hypothetical protein [Rhodoferax sp. TBRC 17199]MDT7517012.1 hypothetical protein [Rhodoferax sp. TBRC 17199]